MREARQGANLIHLDRYTVNQRLLLRSRGILKWGWDGGTSKSRFTKMRRAQLNSRSPPPLSVCPLFPFSLAPRPHCLGDDLPAVPAHVDDYRDET